MVSNYKEVLPVAACSVKLALCGPIGVVSTSELADALVPMGVSGSDVQEMIRTADYDGDGQVAAPSLLAVAPQSLSECPRALSLNKAIGFN